MADDSTESEDLDAGDFSSWIVDVQAAIRGERGSDVPCAGCTACCRSSQFVHIDPDELDTLSHIPGELLFPAPGLPRGHVLLGYDGHGDCPMLKENRCSIYEHRPRTCRAYDCRVFPAAGLDLSSQEQSLIARQARRWQFRFSTPADLTERDSIRAAATFVAEHPDLIPASAAQSSGTQQAVVAIEIHDLFLDRDRSELTITAPTPDAVRVAISRRHHPKPK